MKINLSEILERFRDAEQYEHEQRNLAIKDLLFVTSEAGQWDADAVERRANRPRYTIDRISGAIDQIIGDYRNNRTSLKVEPQNDGTEEVAKVLTGLIRSIEQLSCARDAEDNALQEQIKCGYAGWRIITDYESDEVFEQCIEIKPLWSVASSLYYDPAARDYTRESAQYLFYAMRMPLTSFKKQYPKAKIVDFDSGQYNSPVYQGWFGSDHVRVAEYWWKEPRKKRLGMLSDGRVIDLDEEKAVLDELAEMGTTVIREREVDSYEIHHCKLTGVEVIEQPEKWAGKYFPFIPLWGKETMIEDQRYIRGLIRKAIDAQRIYNYATSAVIEAAALSPKDPFWATPKQMEGHKRGWELFPTKNTPFMFYNPDPAAPGPPQRSGAPQVQQALLAQTQQAARDIHVTTGLEPASLGDAPDTMSGKAIIAQQKMGDRGAYVYYSNFEKSKLYAGKVLIDLIPRIYDNERVVKIMGPDETLETVTLNQPATDELNQPIIDRQTGEQVIVNDLSQGKYSVQASTGPAYATIREETVAQLTQLASQSELIQQLALDIIVDNMNLNKGDELKARIRRAMIQSGAVEPTDQEVQDLGLDQPQQPSPMDMAVMQNLAAETQKLYAEIRNKEADTQKKLYESQKLTIQAIKDLIEGFTKKMEAGLPVTPEERRLYEGQEAIIGETQLDTLREGELGGSPKLQGRANGQPMPGFNPPQEAL